MGNFPAMLAYDNMGNIARDSAGRVYALSDTDANRPLTVTDLNGIPFSGGVVPTSEIGVIAPFRVEGYAMVSWVSGSYRMDIPAVDIIPTDGSPGQVLSRTASGDLQWIDPPASSGGGGGGGGASNGDYWNRTQTVPVIVISATAPWPTSAPEGALIVRLSGTGA